MGERGGAGGLRLSVGRAAQIVPLAPSCFTKTHSVIPVARGWHGITNARIERSAKKRKNNNGVKLQNPVWLAMLRGET